MKNLRDNFLSPILVVGLVLILFSSILDEYIQQKWVFYVVIFIGFFIFSIEIIRYFKSMNKKYLTDLNKIKRDDGGSDKK
jgi:hypothetical protein